MLTRCRVTGNREHGIACVGDSSPRLLQCVISQNQAPELNGGGLYVENSSPQLIDCQILENTALEGGGLYVTYSLMEMTGCTIARNAAVEGNGGGMSLSLSEPKLRQCQFYENSGAEGGGIYCSESTPLLTRCTIAKNQARVIQSDCGLILGGNGGAMYFQVSKPAFVNCMIQGNVAELKGSGLAGFADSTVTLIHCTLVGNQSQKYNRAAIYCESRSRVTVLNSVLWNPGPELAREAPDLRNSYFKVSYSCVQGGWPGEGNLRDYPLFQDPVSGNYHLAAGSPCIDSATLTAETVEDVEGRIRPGEDGLVDMGAHESAPELLPGAYVPPPVVYVRAGAPPGGDGTSWEKALGSIGYALWLGPKEIWVAEGTYKESVQMEEGVSIYGGFAGHETALDQRDGTAHATIVDATGIGGAAVLGANNARLDGFTITGGSFSGVVCSDASPTLADCVITGNRETDHGGLYCERGSPRLTGCVISGNTAIGEGSAGGVTCLELSSPRLEACLILENRGLNAGALSCVNQSSPMLINCVMARNTGRWGGAAFIDDDPSRPNFIHCTITDNTPDPAGAAVYGRDSRVVTLKNCIVWNPGPEFRKETGLSWERQFIVTHSSVQGGWPGIGNLTAYPRFADPTQGDYHLRNASPCIDAATTATKPPVDVDAESRIRPGEDGLADMGAYESPPEFQPGGPATPPVYYVRASAAAGGDGLSWKTAFASIRAALRQVDAPVEIWVAAGTYHECVWLEPSVSVFGGFRGTETTRAGLINPAEDTVIDAGGIHGAAVIGASQSLLDGFTVTGGNENGVFCLQTSPSLSRCVITNPAGYGLYCQQAAPTLSKCWIHGNPAGGIYCHLSKPLLINCEITQHTDAAVSAFNQSRPRLINCTLAGNERGLILENSENVPTLVNCILWNRGPEILSLSSHYKGSVNFSCLQGGWPGEENIAAYPRFVDYAQGDFHLRDGSPCLDTATSLLAPADDLEGNSRTAQAGRVDMGAYEAPAAFRPSPPPPPRVLYVRPGAPDGGDGSSWAGAFNAITAALRIGSASDEVWVAAGTYRESIWLVEGLALYGGFTGGEQIREERNWTAHVTTLRAGRGETATVRGANQAVLDGFSVTGGTERGVDCYATSPVLSHCVIRQNGGCGVYCAREGSRPQLIDCRIIANTGGGVICQENSQPRLEWCEIARNTGANAGGLLCESASIPVLTDCVIQGNAASNGGGILCSESSPTFERCTITGNTATGEGGGGAYCQSQASPEFNHCLISGNAGSAGGGMILNNSRPGLTNCIIMGNQARNDGGGIYAYNNSNANLKNCTITGNQGGTDWKESQYYAGGLFSDDGSRFTVTNSILWDNRPVEFNGKGRITYSDVQGGFLGNGNIKTDPLFIKSWNGKEADVHLRADSPCVDAGDPSAAFNDAALPPGLGTTRCDMGAYGGPENSGWPVTIEPERPVEVPYWMMIER